MNKTYCITYTGEATNWERTIVAEYDAPKEKLALQQYYDEHHAGKDIKLGGIFAITKMTVDGKQFVAYPKAWLDGPAV